jgi:ribonuclease BN (tRNA processing enzyme)
LALAVVDHERRTRQVVFDSDGLKVEAIGVHHGVIPALGFLLTVGDKRIAFGGDQSADNAAFASMIHGADLLVAHHALPESGADDVRHLHRTPSEIGALALDASVGSLVLSHNMARALDDLDAGLEAIASKYKGPVDVARDSSCYPLAP